MSSAGPTEETPPPNLAWDVWLGPAAGAALQPRSYHPHDWRGYWDFGTGAMGDMACHTANLAVHGPQARTPDPKVSAVSGEVNPETYPAWATITYEFPGPGRPPPRQA